MRALGRALFRAAMVRQKVKKARVALHTVKAMRSAKRAKVHARLAKASLVKAAVARFR